MNKVIIFGATGGTGQELVKQALELNYKISVFVRQPEKLKVSVENIQIFKGNVLNQEEVDLAMLGQDVVLCSLGVPANNKSILRTEGTMNIIHAMRKNAVKRLICQTSLGFGDSKEVLPWHMKYLIVPFILKNAFRDHELKESKIVDSSLDWTIVRPGNMTNGKRTSHYKHGFRPDEKIKLKIARADVAEFMLNQIKEIEYIGKKVGISY